MGAQLSLKAAMPLAEILATCRKNVSNTGPRCARGTTKYVSLSIFTTSVATISIFTCEKNHDLLAIVEDCEVTSSRYGKYSTNIYRLRWFHIIDFGYHPNFEDVIMGGIKRWFRRISVRQIRCTFPNIRYAYLFCFSTYCQHYPSSCKGHCRALIFLPVALLLTWFNFNHSMDM